MYVEDSGSTITFLSSSNVTPSCFLLMDLLWNLPKQGDFYEKKDLFHKKNSV